MQGGEVVAVMSGRNCYSTVPYVSSSQSLSSRLSTAHQSHIQLVNGPRPGVRCVAESLTVSVRLSLRVSP